MTINVLIFGHLAEITNQGNLTVSDMMDTNQLETYLRNQYPGLKNIRYAIAVNKNIVSENTRLENNSTVALLPPFSGG